MAMVPKPHPLLLLLVCGACAAAAGQTNLVRNGGFEARNGAGSPAGWRFFTDKTGKGEARVEDGALRLANTSDRGRVSLTQTVRVWRDSPYELRVRIKGGTGAPIFQVTEDVRGAKGYQKRYDHYLESGYAGPWKTFSFKLKSAAKATKFRVTLGLRNRGVAWFDDVSVVCLSDKEPPLLAEDRIELTPWRTKDDIVEGWDWSLPPGVKAVPYSGVHYSSRDYRMVPGNRCVSVRASWRECEPEEGQYDFEPLRQRLADLPKWAAGAELHVYASVWETQYFTDASLATVKRTTPGTAPKWLVEKYGVPIKPEKPKTNIGMPFQVVNLDIWNPDYHSRYLKFVDAFGKSGIAQSPKLLIAYVHGWSSSRGEEAGGRYSASEIKCMKERLAAWARAFKGVERKLAWVGNHGELLDYAYRLGMGQRNGFIEMYMIHTNNPQLGQRIDQDGYLVTDESCPPIAENRAFGDENEEYSPKWHVARFGPVETFRHRYHESMLRALQMRRNFLWVEGKPWVDLPLLAYVSLELGRNVANAPDAWCYLRESIVRHKGKPTPAKNFERWLYQRDRKGCVAAPTAKVDIPKQQFPHHPKHKYDYTARRTDRASGNDRIGFALDDRFLFGGPHRVAIKVTYHDIGKAAWALAYKTPDGEATRVIRCQATGKVKTATFFLDDACFPAKGMEFDFEIRAIEGDATVSFVRVIKLD